MQPIQCNSTKNLITTKKRHDDCHEIISITCNDANDSSIHKTEQLYDKPPTFSPTLTTKHPIVQKTNTWNLSVIKKKLHIGKFCYNKDVQISAGRMQFNKTSMKKQQRIIIGMK